MNREDCLWRRARGLLSSGALGVLVTCAVSPAAAQVPPLVFEMLQNLDSVQRAHAGLALGDFEGVRHAAQDLSARAARLKEQDIAQFKLDASRAPQFDAFLAAQQEAAGAMEEAARARDAEGVLLAMDSLYRNSCLSCHATFRDPTGMLRSATLFMTSFLTGQREIHRGISTRDFPLVARQARELEVTARVLGWDQVIESTFALSDPAAREEFRAFLTRMGTAALRLERAATEEDAPAVLESWRAVWRDGCVGCHERFRPGAPARPGG